MNEIVNKKTSLLCWKCIQDSQNLRIVLVDHSVKTKKEYKSLKKQAIHDIFIKMN